jgi:chromosome segregation ATPase
LPITSSSKHEMSRIPYIRRQNNSFSAGSGRSTPSTLEESINTQQQIEFESPEQHSLEPISEFKEDVMEQDIKRIKDLYESMLLDEANKFKQLKAQSELMNEDIEELNDTIDKLTKERDELRISNHQSEIQSYKQKNQQLTITVEKLSKEVSEATVAKNEYKKAAKSQLLQAEKYVKIQERKLEKLEAEKKDLQEKLESKDLLNGGANDKILELRKSIEELQLQVQNPKILFD